MTSGLHLQSIAKDFLGTRVLHDISLAVTPGEILAITGPSGAGKTTTCRLVSGLEMPDEGEIFLGDTQLTALPASKRHVAHMFESYALYPHLNVAQNIAFPLTSPARNRRYKRADVEAKVVELTRLTQIEHLRHRLPGALSGGQKQRVALCRALAQDAACYLLDEPISHLDAKLRNELRGHIRRRQTKVDAPTLWSTPDAMEALSIGDRVAVLIDGRIEQLGTPEEIYFSPATTSVARLVGDPAMNLLPGAVAAREGALFFEREGVSLALPQPIAKRIEPVMGHGLYLGVRPNAMDIRDGGGPGTLQMSVYAWEPFGKYAIVTAKLGEDLVRIKTHRTERFAANQPIAVTLDPTSLVVFDGTTRRSL
ncbi:ABC transporter ATP-binding protein [Acuticoccus mangrovi]|uniref:ABC transporter ATP-binding protein n=1 Tax=Acuticoccus mangrovi TaxID=2796142 RepID=A0A934IRJ1_9HYPH|nr:ABC transporter ATP-binding protein [Acuticoccus mangrovi]MBJ3776745.1 ABC transporter ATP-binding protein [Acuticoccus mangrovi]